jgi:PKD repeat protein
MFLGIVISPISYICSIGPIYMLKRLYTCLLFICLAASAVSAQECGFIYVTPNGANSGSAGTKATPANLAYGLSLLNGTNNIMRIAQGTYDISNAITIPSNITLEGGYNASTWVKSNSTPTIIHRTSANILSSPNRLVGLSAINSTNFNLLDLTIIVDDAVGNGVTTYGIYVSNCSNYVISRCIIDCGKGSAGVNGLPGAGGTAGGNGGNGESGEDEGNCCRMPGPGGSGSFVGSNAGGNGGMGANRGAFDVDEQNVLGQTLYYACCDYSNDGPPGQSGAGQGGGQGGSGGQKLCNLTYAQTNCLADLPNQGGTGADGANGLTGLIGLQGVAQHIGGYYVPGTGATGQAGLTHGAGGGGGGGGGAKGCEPAVLNPLDGDTVYYTSGSGGGGGGGGEGGQLAQGGSGGSGGGGSFGIYITGNGINGTVQDCNYILAQGGTGGAGGAGGIGGVGGQGGEGGYLGDNGPTNSCNTGRGGNGGDGGDGGNGGNGGAGSNGIRVGLYQDPTGIQVLNPNNYNPFAPNVFVTYTGCSKSDIIISTDATGLVNWQFGFNANPPLSNLATDTIRYTGLGLRSITVIVDGVPYNFANFVNVDQTYAQPAIQASATTICVGSSVNFNTPATMQGYTWTFPGGSPANSSNQNAGSVAFNTAGTYNVRLQTQSCCGISDTTVQIKVLNNVQVSLANDTAICFTDPLPILNAGNPGATYVWTKNGTPIGGNTPTLQTTGAGTYNVTVSYGTGCTGTDSYTLTINTSVPVDLGTDTTAVCIGASLPILNAGIPNSTYQWKLNGNPIGTNTQTIQTTLPGEYEVFVTSPTGCFGSDVTQLLISDPQVNLGLDQSVCANDQFPILDAGNGPGATYVWTLNNNPIGGNTQLLTTSGAGTYVVNLTNQFGCTANGDFALTVNPTLFASITCPPSVILGQLASFADGTTPNPQTWVWNFGDNSPIDNNQNTSHTYNDIGLRPVFMIASNGLCSDTAYCLVDVLYDCNALGLNAAFSISNDTIDIDGFGYAEFTDNSNPPATGWLWNFGDGETSTQQNPVHLYITPGTYTVTLTITNYNCTSQTTQQVIVIDSETGITELTNGGIVKVFPNPATDMLNIVLPDMVSKAQFELYDATGRVVTTQQLVNSTTQVDVSPLTAGMYFFKYYLPNTGYAGAGKLVIK